MGYDGTLKFDTSIDEKGFQSGVSKLGSFAGKAMKATTKVIGAASTAIGAFGAASLKVGMNFESAMANVGAISGSSGKEMEQLSAKAQEMGAKTKFSASEAADAFSYMAMAGWKTGDMMNGIEGIMNLAAASGEDLAQTSDIVTDALTAFGMSAKDSGHFADIMAVASSNANTNVSLMGETFKYVAPVAGTLSFSAEDTAVAIGLMASASIKGSQAGTALRAIISSLTRPSKQAETTLKKLGVSLTDGNGKVKSLNTIMKELRGSFANLTKAQKAEYAATIVGREGMSGLLAIINASDSDYEKLSSAVAGCTNELTGYSAASEMAKKQLDNLQGDVTIFQSALEGFQIAISQGMTGTARVVVQEATGMVNALQDAFKSGGFDAMVDKAGEAFGTLATKILNATPKLIDSAERLINSFLESITGNSSEFTNAAGRVVAKLIKALISVSGSLLGAGVTLFRKVLEGIAGNAREIGSAAGRAVSQLGRSISENAPLIVQAAKDIIKGFCEGLSEEFPGVSALLEGFMSGFVDSMGSVMGGVSNVLKGVFDALNGMSPDALRALGEGLGRIATAFIAIHSAKAVTSTVTGFTGVLNSNIGTVKTFAKMAKDLVKNFPQLGGVISTVTKAVGGSLSALIKTVGGFFGTFKVAFGGISAVIGGSILAITSFVDMFQNGFSIIKEILMGLGIAIAAVGAVILGAPAVVAAVVAGIVAAVATLVIVIKDNWEQIGEFFSGIGDKIVDFWKSIPERLSGALTAVQTWVSNLQDTISSGASNAINSAVGFFTQMPGRIAEVLSRVISGIHEWGSNILSWIGANVPGWISQIVTFFSAMPGRLAEILQNVLSGAISWGAQMVASLTQTAQNCINGVLQWFLQLPGRVWSVFSDVLTKAVQWGSELVSRAQNAAQNAVHAVLHFFGELPGRIWSHLMDVASRITSWGHELANKGANAARSLFDAVVNGIRELPGRMIDIGRNVVSGVWRGICDAKDRLFDNVKHFFSGIVDSAKDALGIRSPSRVMAKQVGRFIPPGVAQGMKNALPKLLDEAEEEMQELAQKMKLAVNMETGDITKSHSAQAQHGTVGNTYHTENFEQNNTYNVPVATPSEIARTQRETARALFGGVT